LLQGHGGDGSSCLILASNPTHVRIEGIAFAGAENGLELEYTALNTTFANVSVLDCHFHEIRWNNFTSNITVIYGGGNAIRIVNSHSFAGGPQPVLENLVVRNNIFANVDMAFSTRTARCGLPEGYRAGVATRNARVEGNLFTNCSFNVVLIDDAVGFSVQHNVRILVRCTCFLIQSAFYYYALSDSTPTVIEARMPRSRESLTSCHYRFACFATLKTLKTLLGLLAQYAEDSIWVRHY
jgi:hypothetical protein